MTTMTDDQRMAVEATAFRTLLKHLAHRTDVQNVDLMAVGGFCRNCLAEWYQSAAKEVGVELDKERPVKPFTACPMVSGKRNSKALPARRNWRR
ncbi:hypothetical protein JCM17844_10050 [Iodidimonas gelatinilytica]|uniref:SMc04008-like domain-containing protein n=1 Tax=Iodidimonas gelatinilytica TaxID=1236966 RepID=A0A5A7MQY6_9PROT|nr:DUF1244 domain-containing protein [Iodidimonas gelatinilytica]GEQ97368.1 hypothetical protein JCM17844_10050 [Iodidimonas gelatinilytica]